ncbi:MAG: molecular chaperone DnaJ [Deltaproteobacteria bacterium RIFCSPLOWO2_02_FULL_44_10]|nr:MAG: molecular chaperone DnaJ [Deltaproteobacteria bacterium RIFCSPHIGHO2_02_FULL_44_16]OGQ46627.1 MAG: molecular chaperone DnaJ [Deltaproteobacteria bacterium RIFCSPLOWO2_02_FULL_44_10]
MTKRDYYEILGVSRTADAIQIKKAYRQLALQYHPDRNRDDHKAEDRFKEASEAYEVLSDAHKRQLYDQFGHQGLHGAGFQGFSGVDDVFSSFGDLFEEFFGGFGPRSRGRSSAQQGSDLQQEITISFHESARGTEREITFTNQVLCDVCEGNGAAPGTNRLPCIACGGSGQITQRQGFFVLQTTCPHCRGAGSRIEKPCDECRGAGRVRKKKKLNVKIPPGIEDGMRLVLRGEGEAGVSGGPSGDLYVLVHVRTDQFFKRKGNDIYGELSISFPLAALGGEVKVKTLEGEKTISISPGTETGDEVRIPKEGFQSVNGHGKGDHIVIFRVTTPKKLSGKQKKLLEQLREELP